MSEPLGWKQTNLHCTSHISCGPDYDYERLFYDQTSEPLSTAFLIWDGEKAAATVSLTKQQDTLFTMGNSHPHISLARVNHTVPWENLGPWAFREARTKDWVDTKHPNVQYSISTRMWRCPYQYRLKSEPTVELFGPPPLVQAASLTEEEEMELSSLPPHLWASSKYDVGLIKNCEPVSITPKSDYRPRRAQYPLKYEAVKGIRPVFQALLESGVIVPCPDSPVRTQFFPSKKARPGRAEICTGFESSKCISPSLSP